MEQKQENNNKSSVNQFYKLSKTGEEIAKLATGAAAILPFDFILYRIYVLAVFHTDKLGISSAYPNMSVWFSGLANSVFSFDIIPIVAITVVSVISFFAFYLLMGTLFDIYEYGGLHKFWYAVPAVFIIAAILMLRIPSCRELRMLKNTVEVKMGESQTFNVVAKFGKQDYYAKPFFGLRYIIEDKTICMIQNNSIIPLKPGQTRAMIGCMNGSSKPPVTFIYITVLSDQPADAVSPDAADTAPQSADELGGWQPENDEHLQDNGLDEMSGDMPPAPDGNKSLEEIMSEDLNGGNPEQPNERKVRGGFGGLNWGTEFESCKSLMKDVRMIKGQNNLTCSRADPKNDMIGTTMVQRMRYGFAQGKLSFVTLSVKVGFNKSDLDTVYVPDKTQVFSYYQRLLQTCNSAFGNAPEPVIMNGIAESDWNSRDNIVQLYAYGADVKKGNVDFVQLVIAAPMLPSVGTSSDLRKGPGGEKQPPVEQPGFQKNNTPPDGMPPAGQDKNHGGN